jgi:hypothetical protein
MEERRPDVEHDVEGRIAEKESKAKPVEPVVACPQTSEDNYQMSSRLTPYPSSQHTPHVDHNSGRMLFQRLPVSSKPITPVQRLGARKNAVVALTDRARFG